MSKSVLDREERKPKGYRAKKLSLSRGTRLAAIGGEGSAEPTAEKPQQDDKEAQKGSRKKAPRKKAKKALRNAVKTAVKICSDELAESLVTCTLEGDSRSAGAMMLSLMEKKNEGEDVKPWIGPSVAQILESEPEWDEGMEETSEAGAGGYEPEGTES